MRGPRLGKILARLQKTGADQRDQRKEAAPRSFGQGRGYSSSLRRSRSRSAMGSACNSSNWFKSKRACSVSWPPWASSATIPPLASNLTLGNMP